MKREEDEPLWDLLGQAKAPGVSPFFARNVLRSIRTAESAGSFWKRWLRPRALAPISASALVLFVGALSLFHEAKSPAIAEIPPALVAAVDPQDYEVVADLDDLFAMEDDSLWDDSVSL